MKTQAKIAIFLVAVMVSLIGFNLIASPSAVSMFKVGQLNGYDVTVTAKAEARPAVHINGLP
jgi:hypothetical protein